MVILLVRKQAIGFFKPSLVVIIVMGIKCRSCLLVMPTDTLSLAAVMVTTEGMNIQKPYLYGIPCGCWLIWVLSSAPLLTVE